MSRARSVSQLVGANTALGNTVITGTISTSTNTATFGTAAYHAANGNFGIGNSSPVKSLHVTGAVPQVRINEAGGGYWDIEAGGRFDITNSAGTRMLSIAGPGLTPTGSGIQIANSGIITTPNQPAFWARKDDGNHTGDGVVVWNTAFLNRGSHYNVSTGRFTAPVAGVYCFFFRMRQTGATGLNMLWEKNDTAHQWQGTIDGDGRTAMGNITVQLAASDTVRVVKYGGGMQGVADYHNLFTGYLLG